MGACEDNNYQSNKTQRLRNYKEKAHDAGSSCNQNPVMNEFIEAVKWHQECVQQLRTMSPASRDAETDIGLLTFCAREQLQKVRDRLKLLLES